MIWELLTALIVLLLLVKIFYVDANLKTDELPFCSSWTLLGPLWFLWNPLSFARNMKRRHPHGFSCWMMWRKITFVFGKKRIIPVVEADNNDLNFADGYAWALSTAFGPHILTRQMAPSQVDLLKRHLNKTQLVGYLAPSQKLVRSIFDQQLGKAGITDLQKVIKTCSFMVGTRNFLGPEVLEKAFADYNFAKVFSGFEIIQGFFMRLMPATWGQTPFAKRILQILAEAEAELRNHGGKPRNVFEDILSTRHDPDGPTCGKDSVLIDLLNVFIFGSGFNGWNMLVYFLKTYIPNEAVWKMLYDEQVRLTAAHGDDITKKLPQMKLLWQLLTTTMYNNMFPFLLRYSEVDFKIPGYVIPRDHLVAYSPQLEHEALQNENDFVLSFGKGTHFCPARDYAYNSMMVIASELIANYRLKIEKTAPTINTMLITFSPQPPVEVSYQRIIAQETCA